MTMLDARKFVVDSFITAFAPGNSHMLDQYFSPDPLLFNHSVSKQFDLKELKARLPNIYKKYQNLKSEIKDIIVGQDQIAFHVKQKAFYEPENKHVGIDVMNLYKLANGKVKGWQIWFSQTIRGRNIS